MQYVFLDSNVFYNQWYFESADFSVLANLINNSNSILLLSEVVCSEVQNLYDREHSRALAEYKKNFERLQRFNPLKKTFEHPELTAYDFKKIVEEKIKFVEYVPYDSVPHSIVVERAIAVVLPFKENEKGYRDTLIWLSLLNYLEIAKPDDVVFFINNNSNDFYNDAKDNLGEIFLKEIEDASIKCSFKVFTSLNQFINREVKAGNYEFTSDRISDLYLDKINSELETLVEDYFSLMEPREFRKLLEKSNKVFPFIKNLNSYYLQIDEGVETGTVLNFKRLSSNEFYIYYSFDLAKCKIEFVIPSVDIWDVGKRVNLHYTWHFVDGDQASLILYCRPAFEASFILNIETLKVDGVELLKMDFID